MAKNKISTKCIIYKINDNICELVNRAKEERDYVLLEECYELGDTMSRIQALVQGRSEQALEPLKQLKEQMEASE